MNQELEQLKTTIEDTNKLIDQLNYDIQNIQLEIDDITKEIARSEEKQATANERLSNYKENLSKLESETQSLESEVKTLTKEVETAINNEKISNIEAKQLDEKISSRLIEEENTKNNLEKFIKDRNTQNSNNEKNKIDILNAEDEIMKHAYLIDSLKAGYQIIENELQVNF